MEVVHPHFPHLSLLAESRLAPVHLGHDDSVVRESLAHEAADVAVHLATATGAVEGDENGVAFMLDVHFVCSHLLDGVADLLSVTWT